MDRPQAGQRRQTAPPLSQTKFWSDLEASSRHGSSSTAFPAADALEEMLERRRAVGEALEMTEAREIEDGSVVDFGFESDELLLQELVS